MKDLLSFRSPSSFILSLLVIFYHISSLYYDLPFLCLHLLFRCQRPPHLLVILAANRRFFDNAIAFYFVLISSFLLVNLYHVFCSHTKHVYSHILVYTNSPDEGLQVERSRSPFLYFRQLKNASP